MVIVVVKIFGLEGRAVHRRFSQTFRVSFALSLLSNLMLAKVTIGEEKSLGFSYVFIFWISYQILSNHLCLRSKE
jgi:hypothetical protein